MQLRLLSIDQLPSRIGYQVWRLRQDVFVVEQECAYADLDGRDVEPGTRQLILVDGEQVVGTLRILDDGTVWRIGRVVVAKPFRGQGLADEMVVAALQATADRDVVLDAQAPLAGWYTEHGFEVVGDEFVEDGIPHLPMRLRRDLSRVR